MKPLYQKLLMVALMMAVLGYTIFNYINGKLETISFMIFALVLGYPLIHFISSIVEDLRER